MRSLFTKFQPSAKERLKPKHRRFFERWKANGGNAREAAIFAGYNDKSGQTTGSHLLDRADVQEAVREWELEAIESTETSIEEVVGTCVQILRASVLDYVTIDSNGQPHINLLNVSRDRAALISQLTMRPTKDGYAVTIKLHDKLAAAEKLLKHLGGYAPQWHVHDHVHHLSKLNPDELADYTDQIARRLGYAPAGDVVRSDAEGEAEGAGAHEIIDLPALPKAGGVPRGGSDAP